MIQHTLATPARPRTIALVGNPNAGKTSVFNALTGLRQKVGNYPGVTVERATGSFNIGDADFEIWDVPGLYSTAPISLDEQVAAGSLHNEPPDLILYTLDAANLERNLFLFSQVAELGLPVVVALTMTDMLERTRGKIDADALSAELGVPVVAVVAHSGKGLDELREAIGENDPRLPRTDLHYPRMVEEAVEELGGERHATRRAILDIRLDAPDGVDLESLEAKRDLVLGAGIQGRTLDSQTRYVWAASVRKKCMNLPPSSVLRRLDGIDRVLTHRVFGLIVFLGIMFLVFQSIYTFAAPLMDLIDGAFTFVGDWVSPMLASSPIAQSLVVDGIIAGVGSVVIFLPQILILFFCIAVLEGSGYLARASFLMDRLLGWCGLNGRAFIPLLSSFACAVPGIMSARVIPDTRSRMATIMVAPLMSCSARLPVYVLLIGAFIEPKFGVLWAGVALFAMHFVGLLVAIPVVYLLKAGPLKGPRVPFLLELPRYRWPRWKEVWRSLSLRGGLFLKTAGTIIFVMSIVIWALLYFPRSTEANARYVQQYEELPAVRRAEISQTDYVDARRLRNSYLGQFGRFIEPIFRPAGFDWRISTAILAAFPAREVVVASMGILFSLGDDIDETSPDLRQEMQAAEWPDGRPLLTPLTAVGLMVFFALCAQCMATLATIKRETGSWKWPTFAFVYMTALAWLFAVGIYQVGGLFGLH